jgi:alpha-tubulin suppressor-like RCC1 family protein
MRARGEWPRFFFAAVAALGCEEPTDRPATDGGPVDGNVAEVTVLPSPTACLVRSVSAAAKHTCALLRNGSVYCWGDNALGQLGQADNMPRLAPVQVTAVGNTAVAVSTSASRTCVRRIDASVMCWGRTPGSTDAAPVIETPRAEALAGNAADVAVGGDHTCTLLANGKVYCAGQGGRVGDGTTTLRATPTLVPGLPDTLIADLAAGPQHTCALMSAGVAYCWGLDQNGSLGAPPDPASTAPPGLSPTAATALGRDLVQLSLGASTTCALRRTNTVACTPPLVAPERPGFGDDNLQVVTGDAHVCVLKRDRTVACAGANDQGQLGLPPPRVASEDPVTVLLPGETATTSAGAAHTCAALADGRLFCWGRATEGQVGSGAAAITTEPVAVAFPGACP